MSSREIWQGIGIGAAAIALGAGILLIRARRRQNAWDQAERAVRAGWRGVQRGARRAVNQSRALGRQVLPEALR